MTDINDTTHRNTEQSGLSSSKLDEVLAKRFSQMRSDDMANTPGFPDESELRGREAIPAVSRARFPVYGYMVDQFPKIAASFALIAVISILATNQPEEDPAAIYAEIMKTHEYMATDHLLVVSESLLPAMAPIPQLTAPRLYDIDLGPDLDPLAAPES